MWGSRVVPAVRSGRPVGLPVAVGEQFAVDLADGVEFLASIGQLCAQLEDLRLGVVELAAQLVEALGAGVDLRSDVAAERFGEALLRCAQLLAQPLVVRVGVGEIGAQRGNGDVPIGDAPGAGAGDGLLARCSTSARRSGCV
jgi:hypothetical protein